MRTALLLLLITLAEATIGVFVKLTGDAIPIHTLNFYALAFATAFLFLTGLLRRSQRVSFPAGNLRDTAIIGVLIAMQISVFNTAMTMAPIANVVIFWSVAPFFVFIFSAVFLGERARWTYVGIFAVALVGVGVAQPLQGDAMAGNLVALADGAIYAAMVTYMRHEGREEPGSDIAWSLLLAALLLAPAPFLFGFGALGEAVNNSRLELGAPAMVWAACLGVVSYGFSYFGISKVLKTISANVYSLVDIIVSPVVAAFLGFLAFGETPALTMIFGGALLLSAGAWLTREMAKERGGEGAANPP